MYEDTPQELVHDLIAEAVFGDHPLGRPVIGTAEVISSIHASAIAALPPADVRAPATRRRRGAGNVDHDELVELVQRRSSGAARPATAARTCARAARSRRRRPRLRFQRKDTEQYHVCLARARASRAPTVAASPRRSSTRSSAAPRRRGSSRRSARSAAWRTRSTRSSRSTPTPGQIGVYVGTREDNLGDALAIAARADRRHRGRQLAGERARAREGEPRRAGSCSRWSRRRRG